MAFLHKISGYLVDVNEDYFEEDIVTEIEQGMDLFSQHLHVETAQIKGWDDENPLNYTNCDLAECEKYFKANVHKVDNNRKVKPEDIDKTLKHLEGRISGMQRAITGLKRIRSGE